MIVLSVEFNNLRASRFPSWLVARSTKTLPLSASTTTTTATTTTATTTIATPPSIANTIPFKSDIPDCAEDCDSSSSLSSSSQQASAPRSPPPPPQQQVIPHDVPGWSWEERARVQACLGRYTKSLELWNKALELQQQRLPPPEDVHHPQQQQHKQHSQLTPTTRHDRFRLAQTLARRGALHGHLGNIPEAATDLNQAVALLETLQKEEVENTNVTPNCQSHAIQQLPTVLAETLVESALIQMRRGLFTDGMQNLEKATLLLLLQQQQQPSSQDGSPRTATTTHNVTTATTTIHHDRVANVLCLVAAVHYQQRHFDKALQRYQQALDMYKVAGVPSDDGRVKTARKRVHAINGLRVWKAKTRQSAFV